MFLLPWRLNDLDVSDLDLLHLHGDDWFYRRRSIPTIRTFHGSALSEARFAKRWRRRASQLFLHGMERRSRRLATSSYGLTPAQAYDDGLAGSLPSGIDLSLDASPDPAGRDAGNPSVLFVGTWEGRKRGKLLHRLFCSEIRPRVPAAELWMVSDRCEGGKGVRWFPCPSDEELAQLYECATLFCLPSLYEGFGIPYLEAMAKGTPVIAAPNVGSQYLLEDGYAGRIVKDSELAASVTAMLQDSEQRAEFSGRGYRRAAQFSWDEVAASHEAAYRSVIAEWQAAPRPLGVSWRLRPAQ
jgi:phosphatidyl-myo-inositol alpha-mannosyltransferase